MIEMEYAIKERRKSGEAIVETADNTKNEEAVIETAKTLQLYHDKKEAEKVAEAITNIAMFTESEEAVIETEKTLQLYYNKQTAEKVAEAIDIVPGTETVIETAKTLALYHNKKEAEAAAEAIISTTKTTMSEEAIIETEKTLRLCYDKKEAGEVAEAIASVARKTENKEAIIRIAKKLRNAQDRYNLDLKILDKYIENISDNIPETLKDSLSIKDINTISNAYTITIDFCKDEHSEFQNKVKEGFFYHLNKAMDNGKTIDDKLKILNKWSDNVYYTFKDHPEYFMEFIR